MVHPAIPQLFWMQSGAKLRRLRRGFSTPRRFLLSFIGVLLGIVYASNIAISVYFREPMSPGRFETYLPLGLMAYVVWDIVKNACRRPDDALVWSRVERERLHTSPFSRRDILIYRFAGVTVAAVAKATLFAVVMSVDIPIFVCGLFGAMMALVFVDLLRMIVSITAFSIARQTYLAIRTFVLGVSAIAMTSAIKMAWQTLGANEAAAAGSIKLTMAVGRALVEMGQSSMGQYLVAPFTIYADVMTADALTWTLIARVAAGLLMVVAAAHAVIRLDEYFHAAKQRAERANFAAHRTPLQTASSTSAPNNRSRITCFSPLTTLIWRQVMGAKRYSGSLLIALLPPTAFSILPISIDRESHGTFFVVVGSLAFYSFVLLPSALKFDFRNDYYRMSVLKALPLKPSTVVLGQLACPVAITTLFQLVLVTTAAPLTGNSLTYAAGAMLVLLPLNVFIFALDNFIFLLYPHPLKQEGLETFARTTLTFTGKGVLFGFALAVMVSWAYCAASLGEAIHISSRQIFVAGLGLLLTAISLTSVAGTIWAYRRFDPSFDSLESSL